MWHIFFSLVWASPKTNQRPEETSPPLAKKEALGDNPSLTYSSSSTSFSFMTVINTLFPWQSESMDHLSPTMLTHPQYHKKVDEKGENSVASIITEWGLLKHSVLKVTWKVSFLNFRAKNHHKPKKYCFYRQSLHETFMVIFKHSVIFFVCNFGGFSVFLSLRKLSKKWRWKMWQNDEPFVISDGV